MLQDGTTFEKAGVNISIVHGILPPDAVQQMRARYGSIRYQMVLLFSCLFYILISNRIINPF